MRTTNVHSDRKSDRALHQTIEVKNVLWSGRSIALEIEAVLARVVNKELYPICLVASSIKIQLSRRN